MRDKFDFLKPKIKKQQEQARKEIIEDLDETILIANRLINTNDYKLFKENFFNIYERALQELQNYKEKDPVLYKIGINEILTRIKVINMFVEMTEGVIVKTRKLEKEIKVNEKK